MRMRMRIRPIGATIFAKSQESPKKMVEAAENVMAGLL